MFNCNSSLFWIWVLDQTYCLQISSPTSWIIFPSYAGFWNSFFNSEIQIILFFLFTTCALTIIYEKPLTNLKSQRFISMFFSESFIVFVPYTSVYVQFALIFVHNIRQGSNNLFYSYSHTWNTFITSPRRTKHSPISWLYTLLILRTLVVLSIKCWYSSSKAVWLMY
jgi:hypothetical protein